MPFRPADAAPDAAAIDALSGQFRSVALERQFRAEYGRVLVRRDRFVIALILCLELALIVVDRVQFQDVAQVGQMRTGLRVLFMVPLAVVFYHYFLRGSYGRGAQLIIVAGMAVHNLLIGTYHHPYLTAHMTPGFLLAVYIFTITAYYTFLSAWLPGTLLVSLLFGIQYVGLRWWLDAPDLDQIYAPFLLFALIAFLHFTALSQQRQHRVIWQGALQARRRQQRAEEMQVFRARLLQLVGHDLNQPLGALRYHVAALRVSAAQFKHGDAERLLLAERLSSTLDEMTDMLDKALELAQLDGSAVTDRCRVQAVAPLVRNLREQFSTAAALAGVELRIHGAGRQVMHDAALMMAVLRNLIRNALQYHSHLTRRPRVVLAFRGGPARRIDVIDNGGGLSTEAQGLRSQHPANHGLGLAIVRHLALKQGWHMDIDNRPGRGVRVSLRLQSASTAGY